MSKHPTSVKNLVLVLVMRPKLPVQGPSSLVQPGAQDSRPNHLRAIHYNFIPARDFCKEKFSPGRFLPFGFLTPAIFVPLHDSTVGFHLSPWTHIRGGE